MYETAFNPQIPYAVVILLDNVVMYNCERI